jgi:hypothetical protein
MFRIRAPNAEASHPGLLAKDGNCSLGFCYLLILLYAEQTNPIPSVIYKPPDSKLVATPVLNGLYHIYSYKKVA